MSPDLAAAWDSMCSPVRSRYATQATPGRARRVVSGLLRWEVARRLSGAGDPGVLSVNARILVVQPDHLGGVLASTPALRLLKASLPTAEITVLAGPWGADVAEHCPAVDRVRTCRFPTFERGPAGAATARRALARVEPYQRLLAEAETLRAERFDLALVLVPDYWSAALVALARIPRRIGLADGQTDAFLTQVIPAVRPPVGKLSDRPEADHVTTQQLRLAAQVPPLAERAVPPNLDRSMSYEPSAGDRASAVRVWRAHDLDEAKAVLAIHPAPGGAPKRWSSERFAMLANHFAGRHGTRVVITGGPDDLEEARTVAAACRQQPVVLAGQTSFGTLAALFERCRAVLGTDNGALHLATAMGVPSLRLFGPTDARVWSGWTGAMATSPLTLSIQSPRLCSPCHRLDVPDWRTIPGVKGDSYPCMADVPADAVIALADQLWRDAFR